jgi:hypothetical protein
MPLYGVTPDTSGPAVIAGMLKLGVSPDEIVAIARTPAKAASRTEAGVKVRYGDYSKPSTLSAALDGVERLLLNSSSAIENRVAEHTNVVEAAVAAGAELPADHEQHIAFYGLLIGVRRLARSLRIRPAAVEYHKLMAGAVPRELDRLR